jgi:hypothetical protein
MKRTTTSALLLLACSCALALPVGAQTMKPGLWEMSNKVSSADAGTQSALAHVQEQLANMSPEQRQSIQDLMQRNGVQINVGAGGALQTKMCLTREMIERREFAVEEGNCRHKLTPTSGNHMRVAFTCTRPAASGEGEMTIDTPGSYRAHMRVRGTDGNNQTVEMDVAGRWLGAECGSVRPVSMVKGK